MGLDMYLTTIYYTDKDGNYIASDDFKTEIKGTVYGEDYPDQIYWRKANAIHNWFVNNVQNGEDECKPHRVSVAAIETLFGTVMTVLDSRHTALGIDNAKTLLPPAEGFFFGDTHINDDYYQYLEETKSALEDLLAENETSPRHYYEYQSSW